MRRIVCFLFLGVLSAGCGPEVDLAKRLEVKNVSTAWWDEGVIGGQNKLVPMITFELANNADQDLNQLQINVLFRRVTEPEIDWGSGFLTNPVPGGFAPGATSKAFTVKSNLGYKGTDPRDVMMKSSYWVDAKVDLYAKYSSVQWKKIGEFPVTRELKNP